MISILVLQYLCGSESGKTSCNDFEGYGGDSVGLGRRGDGAIATSVDRLHCFPKTNSLELLLPDTGSNHLQNYPVYRPGKEPPGYLEWLTEQDPQSAFDANALKTEADWVRAGERVFDSAISYDNIAQIADVRNPEWYEKLDIPATPDGTLPWFRYVIRGKKSRTRNHLMRDVSHASDAGR